MQNPIKYVYVYYDFGENLESQEIQRIKTFLKKILAEQECIGSINSYRGKLNGFLLLDQRLFQRLELGASDQVFSQYSFEEIKETHNILYYVNDKWGRADSFIIFD